jgi:hypothetical protein
LKPFHSLLKKADAFQFQLKQQQEEDDFEIEHIILSPSKETVYSYLHDRFDPARGLEKMLNQATKGSFLRPMTSLQAKIREKELEIRRLTQQKTKQIQEITEKQQKQANLVQKLNQISSSQQFQLKNLYTTLQKTQKDKQKMSQKIDDLQKYARLLEKKIVDLSSTQTKKNSSITNSIKNSKKTGSKKQDEKILSSIPVWCPPSLDILRRNSSSSLIRKNRQENDDQDTSSNHDDDASKNIKKITNTPNLIGSTSSTTKLPPNRVGGGDSLDLGELELLSPSEIGEESCGNAVDLDVDIEKILLNERQQQQQQEEEEQDGAMTPGSQVSCSSLSQRIAAALHGNHHHQEDQGEVEEDQCEQSYLGEDSTSDCFLLNVHQQTNHSSPAGSPGTHATIHPFPIPTEAKSSNSSTGNGNGKGKGSGSGVDAEEFRQLKALQKASELHKNFVHYYK